MADEQVTQVQQALGFWKHVVEQQLQHAELVMGELTRLQDKQVERAKAGLEDAGALGQTTLTWVSEAAEQWRTAAGGAMRTVKEAVHGGA